VTDALALYIAVPVAGFRAPHAREYFETLPLPPPSTVYGMLLSLVGEAERCAHEGAELAVALLGEPALSVVLRTTWRIKSKKQGPGLGSNRRPDFQELLTGLRLAAWVRPGGAERADPCLRERIATVIGNPGASSRFGALSLGESTHLVDEVRALRPADLQQARPLVADPDGDLSLPIWPNHVGSRGTVWGQYRLDTALDTEEPPPEAWIRISRDG
jgi:CRISPR-associated protein Cas5t